MSRQWVRFNDNARAKGNRERHLAENGGEFVKTSSGWEWKGTVSVPKPAPKPAPAPVSRRRRRTTTTTTTTTTEGE